jgi:hypothetical protein
MAEAVREKLQVSRSGGGASEMESTARFNNNNVVSRIYIPTVPCGYNGRVKNLKKKCS